jgi:hypothetical protein
LPYFWCTNACCSISIAITIQNNDGGMFTAREYGAALFGNLFLSWFAKNAGVSDARKAIIIALFVYDLIGFVATTITVIAGVLNPLGWLVVFVYLFFTAGFGYFLVKPPVAKSM